MRTVNFTQLRQNLAAELDSVINDAEEVVVTRSGHEPVALSGCPRPFRAGALSCRWGS